MIMKTPIIRFDHLSFSYRADHPPLLTDLCLEIPDGSITAILGPNGAGKSTLLLLTLGWLTPAHGQIWLNGRRQQDYSRRARGQLMSLVPQQEHLAFAYSLLEYVLLGRAPYLSALAAPGADDYAIAIAALRQTGLEDLAYRSVLELSGGERQMLLIARALTQQPRILLLDEPTTHLDLHNKAQVRSLLRQLQQQGLTLVMTTHDPELALELASQVVLIRQGQTLFVGSATEALTSERLSELYHCPVQVVPVADRRVVVW